METKTWGYIGGGIFIIVLLTLFTGSTKSVERHYNSAEALFRQRDYQSAIDKYNKAIKASKKIGVKSERIATDFPALVNYKIALCYDKLGETKNDRRYYDKALKQIEETLEETNVYKHRENLYFLWSQILYKSKSYVQAELKFSYFINTFPNSRLLEEAIYHNGILNKELDRYSDAKDLFQRIVDEFPTSQFRSNAEYHIPQLLISEHNANNSGNNTNNSKTTKSLQVETMYNTAIEKLNIGDIHEAYQLFSAIIIQFPKSEYSSYAFEGIGDIYRESENIAKARENYEFAINNSSNTDRKDKLYDKLQSTRLIPEYIEKDIQPESQSGLFIKATLLRKGGKFTEAALLYETLSNSNIEIEDVIYALYWGGYCYYRASNFDKSLFGKSVELLVRLISEYEENPVIVKGYYYLAMTYSEWGKSIDDVTKYQLVIQTVNEATQKFSGNKVSSNQVWLSHMQELREYAMLKTNSSNNQPVLPEPVTEVEKLVMEASVHLRINEFNDALMIVKDILKNYPNNKAAIRLLSKLRDRYYEYAWEALDAGKYDEAILGFEQCVNIDPQFIKAYCNLGVLYINQKEFAKAVNVLESAVNIDPHFKKGYYNLGIAQLRLGNFEYAKDAALTALKIDPNYIAAKNLRDAIAD